MNDFFFVYNDTYKKLTFFNLLDITMMLIWLIVILGFAFYRNSKHSELEHYKYYLPNLYFKIGFSLIYAFYYMFVVGGGDTIAYWDMAGCMNNLFWESPQFYFNNLFLGFDDPGFINKYSQVTGYPPGWIMREPEGFFMGKIVSFFSFFTGNSYLVITIMFATITANVSWRFFLLVKEIFPEPNKWLALSVLFIPSVSFWCTGISKDTLVLISILSTVTHGFKLIRGSSKFKLWSIIMILFHVWLLYKIRSVVLITLLIPFFIAVSINFANRFSPYIKRTIRFFIFAISILVFFFTIRSSGKDLSIDQYLKEAEVVQKDFANNASYTGKKYTIEVTDYTASGVLLSFPQAIVAGLLRPFPWEAFSVTLFLNGIESFLLIYLMFRFVRKDFLKKIKFVRSIDFYIFCLFLVLIFGFITGFSSVIFGVLVRLRAPLLIFLGILLTAYPLSEADLSNRK